jgi:hypothetical protein
MHAHEKDATQVEMKVVLNQPHRRGDVSQLCESPLVRFCLYNRLDRAVFDAALDWGKIARHFHSAKLPTKSVISVGFGSGQGVAPKKAEQLAEELTRIEAPLKQLSPLGFAGARDLAIFEKETAAPAHEVVGILFALARLLKKLGASPSPAAPRPSSPRRATRP